MENDIPPEKAKQIENKDADLISIIRKNYLEFLKREPDEGGLNHYLNQIKTGKISADYLPIIFKNSQEYRYNQLVQLRNLDLSISDRMRKDWDDRAEADEKFFIRAVFNQSETDFWKSGEMDCESILKPNTPRYDLIFGNKNLKEMKVLEIGCGIGRLLIPMARIFNEAIGVDVSEKMVNIGQHHVKKIPNCKILHNNGIDLSVLADDYFDFCYSFIVFQHIPEKEIVKNYIREVSRVIKRGGIFRFQVHGDSDKNPVDGTTWNGVHFTSKEMHEIANENKFEILEESGQDDQYYWLTFRSVKHT